MNDKTELKTGPMDVKAREAADAAAEAAKNEPQGEAQKAAELNAKAEAARDAEAEGETLKGEAPKSRVLTKKAFINGRLYEAGEEVTEDEDGNYLAVAKSTPAGSLTVDQLKQLLAQAQAGGKGKSAKD